MVSVADLPKVTVDEEFRGLCPPLTKEEKEKLTELLIAEGCREPLILWKDHDRILLDGHNRRQICFDHGIPFEVVEMEFASRYDAANWIIKNQMGRRNLTEEQKSYLRGKRYEEEKKEHGKRGLAKKTVQDGQSFSATGQRLAEEYGVGATTIRRDAKFSSAVDTITENVGEHARDKILSGQSGASRENIVKLAAMSEEDQEAAFAKNDARVREIIASGSLSGEKPETPPHDTIDKKDQERMKNTINMTLRDLEKSRDYDVRIFLAEHLEWCAKNLRRRASKSRKEG